MKIMERENPYLSDTCTNHYFIRNGTGSGFREKWMEHYKCKPPNPLLRDYIHRIAD